MRIDLFIDGSYSHLKSLAGWGLIVTNENNIIDLTAYADFEAVVI